MCEQVEKLCLLGATDEQVADFFGVAVSTVYLWANEHEAFSEARKRGKEGADANVAHALYHRAIGYEHRAVKIMSFEGQSFEHEYTEHYPPDTAAACYWLNNRQRGRWSNRHLMEHSGPDGGPIPLAAVPDAELQAKAVALAGRVIGSIPASTDGTSGNGTDG